MARKTSIVAYNTIKNNGVLKSMRLKVYEMLYAHGPLTGRELDQMMARAGETRTSYHKRLSELQAMGVVETTSVRACRVSQQMAVQWDVTDQLPVPLPKRKTSRDRVKTLESVLKALKAVAEKNGSLPASLIIKFVDQALQK